MAYPRRALIVRKVAVGAHFFVGLGGVERSPLQAARVFSLSTLPSDRSFILQTASTGSKVVGERMLIRFCLKRVVSQQGFKLGLCRFISQHALLSGKTFDLGE
jgi:hypothetical protein